MCRIKVYCIIINYLGDINDLAESHMTHRSTEKAKEEAPEKEAHTENCSSYEVYDTKLKNDLFREKKNQKEL